MREQKACIELCLRMDNELAESLWARMRERAD